MDNSGVRFVYSISADFPGPLTELSNIPIGLYIRGNSSLLKKKPVVAIVGSRKMTSYGKTVTEKLSSELASTGIVVVSGLALGVDTAAHAACLEVGGSTIAVLGCGVDCCYPQENSNLYSKILAKNGLIISEYPLSASPNKGSFPARNRIIAALADAVLVTEAGVGSGSLITAEIGQKLGRKIFAVPGPITSQTAQGTTQLLKRGATLVSSGEDVLSFLGTSLRQVKLKKTFDGVSDLEQKKILQVLEREAMTLDELSKKINLKIFQLIPHITELEVAGFITSENGKLIIH